MLSRFNSDPLHLLKERLQVFEADTLDDCVADLFFGPLAFLPAVWSCAVNHIPVLATRFEATGAVAMFEPLVSVRPLNANVLSSPDRSIFPEREREICLVTKQRKVAASPLDAIRFFQIKAVIDNILRRVCVGFKPVLEWLRLHPVGAKCRACAHFEGSGFNYYVELVLRVPPVHIAVSDGDFEIVGNLSLKALDVRAFRNRNDVMVEKNDPIFPKSPRRLNGSQGGGMTTGITNDLHVICLSASSLLRKSSI